MAHRSADEIRIGPIRAGPGHPPLVVAEVGINHNGDFRKAVALAKAAKRAGAQCVKYQCHITKHEMIHTDMRPGNISKRSLWDIIQECELTRKEEERLKAACEQIGILFLSTPFSREASDRLEALGVKAYKIGSGELTNLPLIGHIAKNGKPIILSTGMATWREIDEAVNLIKAHGNPLILLQCTSTYPSRYTEIKLGALAQLRDRYRVPVGLSDHSPGIYTGLGAVALGACVIEKHFTMSRRWSGPDQGLSIEPDELAELVRGSRAIFDARGRRERILDNERPVLKFARASVVAIRDIAAGERLSLGNVWVKRPSTGSIPAREFPRILGRQARTAMAYDHQLSWKDVR